MRKLILRTAAASKLSQDEALDMLRRDLPDVRAIFPFDVEDDHYVAHIVESADFPFNEPDGDSAPSDDSSSDGPPKGDSDSDSDDSEPKSDSDGGEKKKDKGSEKGGTGAKLDEILGLLHQLLGGPADAPPDAGPAGLDMPPSVDVGAPAPGDGPLPPPAMKHNMPGVSGGPMFSKRIQEVWREHEAGLTQKQVVAEARALFPGMEIKQSVLKQGRYASDTGIVDAPVWVMTLQEG